MSSYLNNLFNTTASRVASIKQNLLPSESDGDTEDDTHICRVLRGYYTEKGRAFPAWLPPDPRAPPPVVVQPVYTQSSIGRGYGGLNSQSAQGGQGAGGSALSSLWDSQPHQQAGGQVDNQSLRQGRGGPASASGGGRPTGGAPARHNPFARQQSAQELQVQARPLPSQRLGSYQAAGAAGSLFGGSGRPGSGGSGAPSLSARDKLKGQFGQGRRAGSPALSDQSQSQGQGYGRNDSYASNASSGGGGYENRGGYGSSGGGGERPFVAATSPWASNESEFGGGGYTPDSRGGGGNSRPVPAALQPGGRRPGLPSGPRGPRNG